MTGCVGLTNEAIYRRSGSNADTTYQFNTAPRRHGPRHACGGEAGMAMNSPRRNVALSPETTYTIEVGS